MQLESSVAGRKLQMGMRMAYMEGRRWPPDVLILMGSVRNRETKVTIRITGVRWEINSPFSRRCAGSNPARDQAFLVISVGIAVTA